MTTDFDVEPSDEEIRQAHKIYTEASQQRSPHPESDVQWARVILRRQMNWEHMRYENPLRNGIEQPQSKPRNSIESASPTRLPGLAHQALPLLTIPPLPNMSPRISSFSLPTPVKEESEGDVMSLGLAEHSSNQSIPEPSSGVFGSPEPLGALNTEPEKSSLRVAAPPTVLIAEGAHPSGVAQIFTASADSLATVPPRSRSVRTFLRKPLRNAIKRISCFSKGHFPPHARPESVNFARPVADVPSLEESSFHRQSRSSGEIQDVPTSEEPFVRVGNEISALVEGMTSPSIRIQFHARTEDLFPTRSS